MTRQKHPNVWVFHRQLCMLSLIPTAPDSITTTRLQERLAERLFDNDQDLDVGVRTLQRDLKVFAENYFAGELEADYTTKPTLWWWRKSNRKTTPEMAANALVRALHPRME